MKLDEKMNESPVKLLKKKRKRCSNANSKITLVEDSISDENTIAICPSPKKKKRKISENEELINSSLLTNASCNELGVESSSTKMENKTKSNLSSDTVLIESGSGSAITQLQKSKNFLKKKKSRSKNKNNPEMCVEVEAKLNDDSISVDKPKKINLEEKRKDNLDLNNDITNELYTDCENKESSPELIESNDPSNSPQKKKRNKKKSKTKNSTTIADENQSNSMISSMKKKSHSKNKSVSFNDTVQVELIESCKSVEYCANEKTRMNIIRKQEKSISYLQKWKNDRANWKFEKLTQIWLLKNMFQEDMVDDNLFQILLEYCENLIGANKDLAMLMSENVVKKMEQKTTDEKDELLEKAYNRARSVLQHLK